VAVLAIIGVVLTIVLATSSDSKGSTAAGRSGSSGSSDEDQIRSLLTASPGKHRPTAAAGTTLLPNDQEVFKKLGGLGALDVPGGMDGKPAPSVSISDIKVTGTKATADLTVTGSGNPEFRTARSTSAGVRRVEVLHDRFACARRVTGAGRSLITQARTAAVVGSVGSNTTSGS